jgi:hypothetical protein
MADRRHNEADRRAAGAAGGAADGATGALRPRTAGASARGVVLKPAGRGGGKDRRTSLRLIVTNQSHFTSAAVSIMVSLVVSRGARHRGRVDQRDRTQNPRIKSLLFRVSRSAGVMVVKAGKCTSAAIFAGLGCRVVSGSVGFAQNSGARYEPGVDLPERICAVMRWVARSKGLSHNFAKCVHYTQASARPSRRCLQTLARHRRAIFWRGNVLTLAVRKDRGQLYGLHADLPPIPLHDLRHGAPSSGQRP